MRRVFISSTNEDLKPHYRAAARDAAIEAGFYPTMQEYFVASGEHPPLAACLKKLADADVVVVIVAQRYGWKPPDQPGGVQKSITWLECECARGQGKEVLAFVVDDPEWPAAKKEANQITEALKGTEMLGGKLACLTPREFGHITENRRFPLYKDADIKKLDIEYALLYVKGQQAGIPVKCAISRQRQRG